MTGFFFGSFSKVNPGITRSCSAAFYNIKCLFSANNKTPGCYVYVAVDVQGESSVTCLI